MSAQSIFPSDSAAASAPAVTNLAPPTMSYVSTRMHVDERTGEIVTTTVQTRGPSPATAESRAEFQSPTRARHTCMMETPRLRVEHDVGPTHLRAVLRGQPEQRLTPEWVEKRRQALARAEAGCEACRHLEFDDAKMDSAMERVSRLRVRVPSDSESAAIEAPRAPRGARLPPPSPPPVVRAAVESVLAESSGDEESSL